MLTELNEKDVQLLANIALKYRAGYICSRHDLVKFTRDEADFILKHFVDLDPRPVAVTQDALREAIGRNAWLQAAYDIGKSDFAEQILSSIKKLSNLLSVSE